MQLKSWAKGFVLLVLVIVFFLICYSTQWKFKALVLKAGGGLPGVSWKQVISLAGDFESPERSLTSGFVTLDRAGDDKPCSYLWSTPVGKIWGARSDESILEDLVREQLVLRVYNNRFSSIEAGDVVLDVGGHLGSFAFSALQSGAAHVVVFEPEPTNFRCLTRTFEQEIEAESVTLVEAAAWRRDGVLHFHGDRVFGSVSESGKVEVKAAAIDDVVAEIGLEAVDFIKMDIEGGEMDALLGARETISHFRPTMSLSVYHEPGHSTEIPALVLHENPEYRLELTRQYGYFY